MSDRRRRRPVTPGSDGAPERTAPDQASRRLALDTSVLATVLGLLAILSLVADPTAWLLRWAPEPGWGLIGRIVFFLAASHVVMFFFGARRGADLKRELAQRRAAQAQLRYQADHDELTSLPSRASYLRALSSWTSAGRPALVALIDLDRFKDVNDTLGHHVGDAVLRAVAARMAAVMPPAGVLARLGGDEFALLLPDPDAPGSREPVHAVLDAIRLPVATDGLTLEVEASVGIATAPRHGTRPADLLRRADLAMYAAKADQLGILEFTPGLDDGSTERLALHSDLKKALVDGGLYLVFQPKVAMADGQVVGVEALVRWRHPCRGVLEPASFLPVAEPTELIRPLTDLVLDLALGACRTWREHGLTLPVAVNLSPRSLLDHALPVRVARCLAAHGLEPRCLELEVTENAAMTNPALAVRILTRLSDLGVRLSVDDFGTGHASLAYLSQLPVDTLKIDRSFVQCIDHDPAHRMIVRSTVGLAHDLGLTVVAEGVATDAAWQLLRDWGCDQAQGRWLSPPLGQDEVPSAVVDLMRSLASARALPQPRLGDPVRDADPRPT